MTGFESHMNSHGDIGVVTWRGHTVFFRSWLHRAIDGQDEASRLVDLEQSFASRLFNLMEDGVTRS